MKHTVQITIDGKTTDLPVLEATVGLDVVDVRSLIGQGVYTYDPGFLSTAACDSSITYIDGDAGVLTYCGYPIEQLADHSEHLEVCYLLLHSELPTEAQLQQFRSDIADRMPIDLSLRKSSTASLSPRTQCPCCVQQSRALRRNFMMDWTSTMRIIVLSLRCS